MSFFSINPHVLVTQKLTFDLYINSSASKVQKFLCILKHDSECTADILSSLTKKYSQFYVREEDRSRYLQLIGKNSSAPLKEKTAALKDVAMNHLKGIVAIDWKTASSAKIAESVVDCKETVQTLFSVVEKHSLDEIKGILSELSFHDFYTFDHSVNVCIYSLKFFEQLFPSMDQQKKMEMGMGALLHDIGKMQISTSIINKPSELSNVEFSEIKKHPVYGLELFQKISSNLPADLEWKNVIDIISQHHENHDGTGYPYGISHMSINIMAKICTFADIFDALTTKRSYSETLSKEKTIEIMAGLVGKKLDPTLFKKFKMLMIPEAKSFMAIENLIQLHPNFDPSVQYRTLEVMKNQKTSPKSNENFGGVIVLDDKKNKVS